MRLRVLGPLLVLAPGWRVIALAALLPACGRADRMGVRPTLVLLDSAAVAGNWNPMGDSMTVYRFVVRGERHTDTLRNVIEPLPPVVAGGRVVGLRVRSSGDDSWDREIFTLDVRAGQTRVRPIPGDVYIFFHDLAISPTGEYLAYVGDDSISGRTYAAVRRIATGERVLRTKPRGGCDCDVDMNHARWVAPDSFEIAVALLDHPGWEIVRGSAARHRLHVDTVAHEPAWHEVPPH